MIARTYKFPAGSLIFYSGSDWGEIVLYDDRKRVVYEVNGEFEVLEKEWKNIIQKIEQDFLEVIVKRLKEIEV